MTDHKFRINQKAGECVGYKLYNPEQIFQFILNKFFFNYTEIKRNWKNCKTLLTQEEKTDPADKTNNKSICRASKSYRDSQNVQIFQALINRLNIKVKIELIGQFKTCMTNKKVQKGNDFESRS